MRYLPLNDEDRADMLARIGAGHIDAICPVPPQPAMRRARF